MFDKVSGIHQTLVNYFEIFTVRRIFGKKKKHKLTVY
jgi:hypothetical protein